MSTSFKYLVVGGGNAAGYACKEFVAQGVAAGEVGVICAEAVAPYERPALTKAYLNKPGAKIRARLPGFHTCVGGGGERQTPEWYKEKGIALIQGKATNVNLEAKSVKVGETEYTYEKLFLATGCSPLRVSRFGVKGDDLKNVFYVREEKEAGEMVQALEALGGKGKLVIIGGGYIGLECAAALSGWGFEITMVFPEANVMPRLFDSKLGGWLEDEYSQRGIKFLKGDSAVEFLAGQDGVDGVKLKSGDVLPATAVVVGVGATVNTQYCTGLNMDKNGFAVNEFMQTSNPDVYAIGDIATFPSQYGGTVRQEHVDHARRSAAQAVQAAMGKDPQPYKYLPFFYSRIFEEDGVSFNFFGDQGDPSNPAECQVCPLGTRSIGAIWVKKGKVVGALLMGAPGPSPEDANKLRNLVTSGVDAQQDVAAVFESVDLKPAVPGAQTTPGAVQALEVEKQQPAQEKRGLCARICGGK